MLQDINASSTQSLPPGTQPLLPSQLVDLATSHPAQGTGGDSHTDTVPSPHADGTEASWTPSASPDHVPLHHTTNSVEDIRHATYQPDAPQSVSASSESGHGDVADPYYSTVSSGGGHVDESSGKGKEYEDEGSHVQPFSVYGYQDHQHFTDFETDTSASTSFDDLSPPGSSRVSSLDLHEPPPSLARTVSSNSIASSTSSTSIHASDPSRGHHEQGLSSLGPSTNSSRPSLEDSDSLRSPPESEYLFTPPSGFGDASSTLYHTASKPTHSLGTDRNTQTPHSSGRSSPLLDSASIHTSTQASSPSLSSFPQWSSIYDRESDFVASWRNHQFASGSFFSDTDLSETLALSDPALPRSTSGEGHGSDRLRSRSTSSQRSAVSLRDGRSESSLSTLSLSMSSSSSSLANLPPTSHPLPIPPLASPHAEIAPSATDLRDRRSQRRYGGYLGALEVEMGAWPSSADTVRPMDALATSPVALTDDISRHEHDAPAKEGLDTGESRNRSLSAGNSNSSSWTGAGDFSDGNSHEVPTANAFLDEHSFHLDHDRSLPLDHDDHRADEHTGAQQQRHEDLEENDKQEVDTMAPYRSAGAYDGFGLSAGMVDGGAGPRSSSRSRPGSSGQQYNGGSGYGGWGVNGGGYDAGGWGRGGSRSGGFSRGDGDDDEHDDRRRRHLHQGPESPYNNANGSRVRAGGRKGAAEASASGSMSSASDTDDSSNQYGRPHPLSAPATRGFGSPSSPRHYQHAFPPTQLPNSSTAPSSSDDDDVPLAQRIPTALDAQKSIRRQVREERHQKKLERAATSASAPRSADESRSYAQDPFARERHTTLRPVGAGGPSVPPPLPLNSSQEAALHARAFPPPPPQPQSQPVPRTRQRAATIASRPTQPTSQNPFSAEDLAQRLQNVQLAAQQQSPFNPSSPRSAALPLRAGRSSFEDHEKTHDGMARGRSVNDGHPAPNVGTSMTTSSKGLRLMRSFTRDKRSHAGDEFGQLQHHQQPALPADAEQKIALSRMQSRSQSRARGDESPNSRKRSLSISSPPSSPRQFDPASAPPVPPMPPLPGRASIDEQNHASWKQWKRASSSGAPGGLAVGRKSINEERRSPNVPSVPLPSAGQVVQQRVFVGDLQRFNMVEISASTTAGDVIEMIEAQGGLKGLTGVGEWMVWEVVQDFGMGESYVQLETAFKC